MYSMKSSNGASKSGAMYFTVPGNVPGRRDVRRSRALTCQPADQAKAQRGCLARQIRILPSGSLLWTSEC